MPPGVRVQPALAAPKDLTQCTCVHLQVWVCMSTLLRPVGGQLPTTESQAGKSLHDHLEQNPNLGEKRTQGLESQ